MRHYRNRRRKAGLLLEFVMLLPITLILFMVLVDGARVLLISGAVSDATYRSARAGAVVGGASYGDVAGEAFAAALDEIPGGSLAVNPEMIVVSGERCSAFESYVEIKSTYTVDLFTPGLAAAFGFLDRETDGGGLRLDSTAVARCEVAP
jgi:Flp pilus assembly protein TadG